MAIDTIFLNHNVYNGVYQDSRFKTFIGITVQEHSFTKGTKQYKTHMHQNIHKTIV